MQQHLILLSHTLVSHIVYICNTLLRRCMSNPVHLLKTMRELQVKKESRPKDALRRLLTPRNVLLRSHSQTHVVVSRLAKLLAQALVLAQALALESALAVLAFS